MIFSLHLLPRTVWQLRCLCVRAFGLNFLSIWLIFGCFCGQIKFTITISDIRSILSYHQVWSPSLSAIQSLTQHQIELQNWFKERIYAKYWKHKTLTSLTAFEKNACDLWNSYIRTLMNDLQCVFMLLWRIYSVSSEFFECCKMSIGSLYLPQILASIELCELNKFTINELIRKI